MKLRAERREQSPLTCDFDALNHDAMAAHALMMALRCEAPGVYARAIAKADSILREWGFDSGEVGE